MKKLILLFAVFLLVTISYGQRISTIALAGDSIVTPTDSSYIETSEAGLVSGVASTKVMRIKPVFDAKVDVADSSGVAAGSYVSGSDFVAGQALKVNISDTATMLTPYETDANVALKVNIADTASMLSPYETDANVALKVNISDTASMLTNYPLTSEVAATYAPLASPTFTTSITIGSAGISEAELEILDGATISTTELNHLGSVTSAIQTQLDARLLTADTVDGTQVLRLLSDTATFFAWTIGGEAGDTALFTTNDVIAAVKWNGSHTLNMTKVTGVMGSGSKDIDIAVLADVNYKDGTPTEMLSADLSITSSTTGDEATSFTDATLAPGEWLWIRVDECTAQPAQCIITIDGFLSE